MFLVIITLQMDNSTYHLIVDNLRTESFVRQAATEAGTTLNKISSGNFFPKKAIAAERDF